MLQYRVLYLCLFTSLAYGWTIHNRTSAKVNIHATYWGELFCSPDDFWLVPGEKKEISAGLCAIRSLTSGNGAFGLNPASGRTFHIIQDGGSYYIRQGE